MPRVLRALARAQKAERGQLGAELARAGARRIRWRHRQQARGLGGARRGDPAPVIERPCARSAACARHPRAVRSSSRDNARGSRTPASSAAGVRAETSSTSLPRGDGVERTAGGASSSTACAFVPPKPNELTPARRGPALAGHCASSVWTRNGVRAKSIFGVRRREVDRRWDQLVVQRERRLDQARSRRRRSRGDRRCS